jgi:ParB-like chromosome segregation protein Spo0J
MKLKRKDFEENAPRVRIENIALAEIRTDAHVQPREPNPSVVSEYQERMTEGDVFTPVVVFLINTRYLLVDGHHRFEAAKLAKKKTLRCEVAALSHDWFA